MLAYTVTAPSAPDMPTHSQPGRSQECSRSLLPSRAPHVHRFHRCSWPFKDTGSHLLLGASSSFVKLSGPRKWLELVICESPGAPVMAWHLHTQPLLSPGTLCSQWGKALRLEVIKSLSVRFSNTDLYRDTL